MCDICSFCSEMTATMKVQRQSSRGVLCSVRCLRNFTKFTGQHLFQSLFFNKVAGLGGTGAFL